MVSTLISNGGVPALVGSDKLRILPWCVIADVAQSGEGDVSEDWYEVIDCARWPRV